MHLHNSCGSSSSCCRSCGVTVDSSGSRCHDVWLCPPYIDFVAQSVGCVHVQADTVNIPRLTLGQTQDPISGVLQGLPALSQPSPQGHSPTDSPSQWLPSRLLTGSLQWPVRGSWAFISSGQLSLYWHKTTKRCKSAIPRPQSTL